MGPDSAAVRHGERLGRFYDVNARRFERLGQGGTSIHRAVRAPGVGTRAEAFRYADRRVLAELPDVARPLVVDLGCGVGASLLHLATVRPDLRGEGITISPAQAERAGRLLAEAGVADRVRCRVGDFLAPPGDLTGADLAFSIEAFVHGADAAGYFRAAASVLRPGGRLVIVDDVLTERGAHPDPAGGRRLAHFRRGWRIGSLLTAQDAGRLAAAAGFVVRSDDDLTSYLELRRPRDRVIAVAAAVSRAARISGGEYWRSLVGGDALQWCLRHGLVGYRVLVFERLP